MVKEKAYAKVNLGLKVLDKRSDGYHNLEMVMASVDLFDELTFENSEYIDIITNKEMGKIEDNLIYKATKLIQETYGIRSNPKITVDKRIPIGGGLAGGSSDAAATIRGLNQLWKLGLTYEDMYSLALKLGSDVPFCLTGKIAYVGGRGELIIPLLASLNATLILVFPNYQCYTKEIFAGFIGGNYAHNISNVIKAIMENDLVRIGKSLFNDLEYVVNALALKNNKVPISQIKVNLMANGCLGTTMSGSGSTVIGLCENDQKAREIVDKIRLQFPSFTVKIVKII
jgi:4-diphosphocytidyl-2-C-methyl-D-erythritol kinase